MKYAVLHLKGPMQSWGIGARGDVRPSEPFPTLAGVVGMVSNGLGVLPDSDLQHFKELYTYSVSKYTTLVDYQNVGAAHSLSGFCTSTEAGSGQGNNRQTFRTYLVGAEFICILEVADAIDIEALSSPKASMFLGRRCCVPSAPIYVGVYGTLEEAQGVVESMAPGPKVCQFPKGSSPESASFLSLMDRPLLLVATKKYAPRAVGVFRVAS